MIIPTSPARAREMTDEFTKGTVKKEYIARVKGKFPECVSRAVSSTSEGVLDSKQHREPVTCSEPLLTVDRQMGLNIVHPDGKPALTVFTRLFYDEGSDSSVVKCEPHTGRCTWSILPSLCPSCRSPIRLRLRLILCFPPPPCCQAEPHCSLANSATSSPTTSAPPVPRPSYSQRPSLL